MSIKYNGGYLPTVGADGSTLVANSSASTGVSWAGPMVTAGKNGAINGAFDIWQRGTSISVGAAYPYTADRWQAVRGGVVAGMTVSRQNSGLTGLQYCARLQRDSGNTSTAFLQITNSFESSESYRFAGQTVTYSFYARAGANYSGGGVYVQLTTGTGTDQNGVTSAYTGAAGAITATSSTPTTSWARYFFTTTLSSSLTELFVALSYTPTGTAGTNDYLEVTGVQLELGTVPTAFSRAGGTLQGELCAAQRYYSKSYDIGTAPADTTRINSIVAIGVASTSRPVTAIRFPVTMRTSPTVTIYATDTGTSANMRDVTAGTNVAAAAGIIGDTGSNGTSVYPNGVSTTANNLLAFHYTASAEL